MSAATLAGAISSGTDPYIHRAQPRQVLVGARPMRWSGRIASRRSEELTEINRVLLPGAARIREAQRRLVWSPARSEISSSWRRILLEHELA